MIPADMPQSVAMAIAGHRTVSVFLGYNVSSGDYIRDALRRTQALHEAKPIPRNITEMRPRAESR
jgi:hypothetical protein